MSAARAAWRRWLPYPALSALLAGVWLLLSESLALPTLLAAGVLAVAVPRFVAGFLGRAAAPRRAAVAVQLAGRVLKDLVVSNFVVARLVVDPSARPQPAWVEVPLDVHDPMAIFLLATIITMTPGTVSCVVDEGTRSILVHALDCSDPAAVAADIKQRYEQPLKAIFEGADA